MAVHQPRRADLCPYPGVLAEFHADGLHGRSEVLALLVGIHGSRRNVRESSSIPSRPLPPLRIPSSFSTLPDDTLMSSRHPAAHQVEASEANAPWPCCRVILNWEGERAPASDPPAC